MLSNSTLLGRINDLQRRVSALTTVTNTEASIVEDGETIVDSDGGIVFSNGGVLVPKSGDIVTADGGPIISATGELDVDSIHVSGDIMLLSDYKNQREVDTDTVIDAGLVEGSTYTVKILPPDWANRVIVTVNAYISGRLYRPGESTAQLRIDGVPYASSVSSQFTGDFLLNTSITRIFPASRESYNVGVSLSDGVAPSGDNIIRITTGCVYIP